jgi:hypothetical protein
VGPDSVADCPPDRVFDPGLISYPVTWVVYDAVAQHCHMMRTLRDGMATFWVCSSENQGIEQTL